MVLNYYTLYRLVESWKSVLAGARIVEAFSQTKDVLHVGVVTKSRDTFHLEISLDGKRAYVALRSRQSRKGKNSVDLFPDIMGRRVTDCRIQDSDRQIEVELDSGQTLLLRLYGSMNVYLLSSSGKIIDSFKDSKNVIDEMLARDLRDVSWRDESKFAALYPKAEDLEKALHAGLAGLNWTLATEFLWRMRETPYDAHDAYHRLQSFVEELSTSPLRIIYRQEEPFLLSPTGLHHLADTVNGLRETAYDDPNDAILDYIAGKTAFDARNRKREAVLKACKNRIRKQRTLLKKLQGELDQSLKHEEEEQKANLLTMNLASISRGMTEIELDDVYHEGNRISISLDPSLSPQENVARRYTRARKMKKSIENLNKRLGEITSDITHDQHIADTLSDPANMDWKLVEKTHAEFLKLGRLQIERDDTKAPDRSTFREFCVSGNWRVFVGQNDKKNDELTFQFADKNDLWFHARGVPGSHVLLKRDGRKDNPSKRAIEEAASIAAYFSKSKTSSMVAVIMTARKYVRKRKGLRPGQVIVEREEVVMAEPADPAVFNVNPSTGSG